MDVDIASVLIYVKGHSDNVIRHGIENSLRRDPGVLTVGLPEKHDHLVMVGYNPKQTTGLQLVQRAECSGVHARVVGL